MIFIRILIKGYLKNITENEVIFFEEKGIKNKNKITYTNDTVKYSIRCSDNEIIMVREGNDFINTFVFNKKKSNSNYFLKDNNCDLDMDVNTIYFEISDTIIFVKYEIVETGCLYEYRLEMSEIL